MEKLSKHALISCEEAEMAIIDGSAAENPAVQEHLRNCAMCREFAQFQQELLNVEPAIASEPPEFAAIKAEAQRRQNNQRRFLRFAVLPLGMAAALTLVLGGIFFHGQLAGTAEKVQQLKSNSRIAAAENKSHAPRDWNEFYQLFEDNENFSAALEENTVTLAWDQHSSRELQLRNSLNDARSGDQWSIEFFNPYSEE